MRDVRHIYFLVDACTSFAHALASDPDLRCARLSFTCTSLPRARTDTSSDYCATWPYIPRNLTLFSLDDYPPAWMYPSSHCTGTTGPLCKQCRDDGWPRPPGCENETERQTCDENGNEKSWNGYEKEIENEYENESEKLISSWTENSSWTEMVSWRELRKVHSPSIVQNESLNWNGELLHGHTSYEAWRLVSCVPEKPEHFEMPMI